MPQNLRYAPCYSMHAHICVCLSTAAVSEPLKMNKSRPASAASTKSLLTQLSASRRSSAAIRDIPGSSPNPGLLLNMYNAMNSPEFQVVLNITIEITTKSNL